MTNIEKDNWTSKLTKEQFSMLYPNFPVEDIIVWEDWCVSSIRAKIAVVDPIWIKGSFPVN